MSWVEISTENGIAIVSLQRGRVNALHEPLVDELQKVMDDLKLDPTVKAVILTGKGKFFSFGFDIPEFLHYSREDFVSYLGKFSSLCTELFIWPKPIIAGLNGHAVAGGCMLAITCDYRLMVTGKAKISLNEITFGASVFASTTAMLQYWLGGPKAQTVLYRGSLYSAEEALALGIIDRLATESELLAAACQQAEVLAGKDMVAFASIKKLLRQPAMDLIKSYEADSIREFVDIWYSPTTWVNLQNIKIHG
ncbi:MAG: enoyl-CoA hydratase/isomerase family protein [Deltaproteobacteria bacterium]|nr:enoyl-CoA hydratase/isomerase family protein [Deltaproteobacteria bacterium]